MQTLMLTPKMLTLLATAGILHVVEVRQLKAKDVDHLLKSAGVRCIVTHCFDDVDDGVAWLAPAEQDRLWQEEIRPRLVNRPWDGWFDAWEWRTDQQEPIILFRQCYAPI